MWIAQIKGVPFLYCVAKSCLTNIFLNTLEIILFVSDWRKSHYQFMSLFTKTWYTWINPTSIARWLYIECYLCGQCSVGRMLSQWFVVTKWIMQIWSEPVNFYCFITGAGLTSWAKLIYWDWQGNLVPTVFITYRDKACVMYKTWDLKIDQ